jgi:hypothetical protein
LFLGYGWEECHFWVSWAIAELLTSYWQVSKDIERGEEAREKFILQNQIHSDFHSLKRFHVLHFQNFPVAH